MKKLNSGQIFFGKEIIENIISGKIISDNFQGEKFCRVIFRKNANSGGQFLNLLNMTQNPEFV